MDFLLPPASTWLQAVQPGSVLFPGSIPHGMTLTASGPQGINSFSFGSADEFHGILRELFPGEGGTG